MDNLGKEILVILCGGRSSRMGTDKALLPFPSLIDSDNSLKPLALRMQEKFILDFEVFFSLKEDLAHKMDFNAKFLIEETKDFHPIYGICNSLEILQKDIYFITIDTPFIAPSTLKTLSNSKANFAYISTSFKSHYLINRIKKDSLNILDKFKNNESLKLIIEVINSEAIIAQNEEEFKNLNTKSQYLEALSLLP